MIDDVVDVYSYLFQIKLESFSNIAFKEPDTDLIIKYCFHTKIKLEEVLKILILKKFCIKPTTKKSLSVLTLRTKEKQKYHRNIS